VGEPELFGVCAFCKIGRFLHGHVVRFYRARMLFFFAEHAFQDHQIRVFSKLDDFVHRSCVGGVEKRKTAAGGPQNVAWGEAADSLALLKLAPEGKGNAVFSGTLGIELSRAGEGQLIKEHPEYEMEDRLLLDKIDFDKQTVTLDGKVYPLIMEAASSSGCYGEIWEINEPGVAEYRPWFMTGAGTCLYAINQMLLSEQDGECLIGAGVPKEWKDWSFRLPSESGYEVEFAMKGGVVTKLVLRQQANNNKMKSVPRAVKVVLPDGSRRMVTVLSDKDGH